MSLDLKAPSEKQVSSNHLESYQYSALQRSPAQIRLLTVEPGEIDDNVKCTIRHVPLENCPLYEAVSYTWGNRRRHSVEK